MHNPEHSVVHLTIRKDKQILAIGTGVLYLRNNQSYIVTAWHNIAGRHTETLKLLNKHASIPNNIIVSLDWQMKENDITYGYSNIRITVPLIENDKTTYYVHKQGYPKVDVVAIPIDVNKLYQMELKDYSGEEKNISISLQQKAELNNSLETDIVHIQDCEFEIKEINNYYDSLYVSDDIFVIGYPKGITDYTMQPIWKRATVATPPSLGWNKQEQFLIDCASKEGMSGAPAIYYNRDGKINTGNTYYKGAYPITILHGIYVGRLGSTSELEAQIGKVWKRNIIDEIIDDKLFDYLPEELILSDSDIENAINEEWPKENNDYAKMLLNDEASYKYVFLNSVMRNINGRADKDEVLKIILEIAKNKLDSTKNS